MKREIHYLTNDDDERQELWVYCLSGNSIFTLREHLDTIKKEQEQYKNLIEVLIKE